MASQFISNSTVTYDVATDGTTTVTHDITLQNTTSDFYATSYTLSLSGISPINPAAIENGQTLPVKVTTDKGTTNLEIDFPDAIVGKDAKREFVVKFIDRTLVVKTGEIREITAPKLADSSSFDFYSTVLHIPNSFGNLAYMSPQPDNKSTDNSKMTFNFGKNASLNNAITAGFGNFQVFSFNLTYHLENPLRTEATVDVALPPDTSYQKMNYTNISPSPAKITVDGDGNWLATYDLKPGEKRDVIATGAVQIFSNYLANPKDMPRPEDLQPTDLWQINDPKIVQLAQQLKTPKAIYDYVSKTLSYDYSKIQGNAQRMGALSALAAPSQSICTEFTDLFIAIARAAHIPAREIEGFAYTDNPSIQPLSLVADVLHAWPEYWDADRQIWIPVDPTWGSTSGIDYFNKLDLRHFAFVVHGEDARKPYPAGSYKLGANPQKDVNVTFGSLPTNRNSQIQIANKVISQIPFSDEIVDVKISNSGPVALYNQTFSIVYDNTKAVKSTKIDVIPPYGYFETNLNVPYSFLGDKTPAKVELMINDSQKGEFATYKTFLTISNLLLLFLFVFFIVIVIYLKFHDAKTKKHTSGPGGLSV